MAKPQGLRFGPLGAHCVHICVDMQLMFAGDTQWHVPWMERVRPKIHSLCEHRPEQTIFTRFIPAQRPGEGQGTWARYWEKWAPITRECMGDEMTGLLPELAAVVPPAEIHDKHVYSPWIHGRFEARLRERRADTLIVSGGETDICVLATILGGVDRGFRMVAVEDALCSSSDKTHDALMTLYRNRYGEQVETVPVDEVIAAWR